jgi:hypothetical protein
VRVYAGHRSRDTGPNPAPDNSGAGLRTSAMARAHRSCRSAGSFGLTQPLIGDRDCAARQEAANGRGRTVRQSTLDDGDGDARSAPPATEATDARFGEGAGRQSG